MSGKHYFKSDGNGGFVIGKNTLAIVIGLITIFSIFAGIVIAYQNNAIAVDSLKAATLQSQEIESQLQLQISGNSQDIAVLKVKIDNIDSNVREIKELLKNG